MGYCGSCNGKYDLESILSVPCGDVVHVGHSHDRLSSCRPTVFLKTELYVCWWEVVLCWTWSCCWTHQVIRKKNLVYENQGSVWFVEIVLLGEWTFFSGLMKTYNFMSPCVECMSSVKGVWLFKSPQKYCYTILFEQCFHPCVKSLSSIMLTTLQDPNSYMVISKGCLAAFCTWPPLVCPGGQA